MAHVRLRLAAVGRTGGEAGFTLRGLTSLQSLRFAKQPFFWQLVLSVSDGAHIFFCVSRPASDIKAQGTKEKKGLVCASIELDRRLRQGQEADVSVYPDLSRRDSALIDVEPLSYLTSHQIRTEARPRTLPPSFVTLSSLSTGR